MLAVAVAASAAGRPGRRARAGAGHTQLEPADACTACGICSPSGTADPAVVLAYATRCLTAFFARELLGDTGVGATFDGALGPADVAAGRVTIMGK